MKRAILTFAWLMAIMTGTLAQDLSTSANDFLNNLGTQKSSAQFPIDDTERFNFNFVPLPRKGPTFHDFSEKQKNAGLALLKMSLGESGYKKATAIVANESVLRMLEGRPDDDTRRDPLNYHFSFFGNPSGAGDWFWRFEGHHCSLNFAIHNNEIVSSTPSFFGSNPAIVPRGEEKGRQILKQETDLGFELINSMNEKQLAVARFSDKALPEIVSGNDRKAKLLSPAGISYKDMSESQKQLFLKLLDVYVKNYVFGFSNKFMEKIKKAGIENLSFAWAGSLKPGPGEYYRIQGPMLLIEYDNTQTEANHVHTAVRDLTNDFAEDILREHYAKEHAK